MGSNQRLVFYPINNFDNQIHQDTNIKNRMLYPIIPLWEEGFYGFETQNNDIWQWSKKTSKMSLDNSFGYDKKVQITMIVETTTGSNITINSDLFNDTIVATSQTTRYTRTFVLPKGKHDLIFSTNGTRIITDKDPREMYFRLINFDITEQ
jgi:phosphoglycerol transferase